MPTRPYLPSSDAIYNTKNEQALGVRLMDEDFDGTLALVAFAASAVYGNHPGSHHFMNGGPGGAKELCYDLENSKHKLETEHWSEPVGPEIIYSKGRLWGTNTYTAKQAGDIFRGRYYTSEQLNFVIAAFRGTVSSEALSFVTGGTSTAQYRNRSYSDWDANNDMWNGRRPWHLTNALNMIKEIEKKFPGKPIILTGHSLGGGIAQLVGYVTGWPMLTLNAPRVLFKDYGRYSIRNLVDQMDTRDYPQPGHSDNTATLDRFGRGLFLRTWGDAVSREGGDAKGAATTKRYYPVDDPLIKEQVLTLGPQMHNDIAVTAHQTGYLLGYFLNTDLSHKSAYDYFFNEHSVGVQTTTREAFSIQKIKRPGFPSDQTIYLTPANKGLNVKLSQSDFDSGSLALVAFAASAVYGNHPGPHHFVNGGPGGAKELCYDLENSKLKLETEHWSEPVGPKTFSSKGRLWGTNTYTAKQAGDTFRGRYYTSEQLNFVIAAFRGTVSSEALSFVTGGTSTAQYRNRAYSDWDANNDMWNGRRPWHLTNALDMIKKIEKKFPGKPIILTGHSLGGGIAQLVGYVTGWPMLTLNAPRVLFKDYGRYSIRDLVDQMDTRDYPQPGHSDNTATLDRFGRGLFLRTWGDAVSREGGDAKGAATTKRYYPVNDSLTNEQVLTLGPEMHNDIAVTAHQTGYLLGYFLNTDLSHKSAYDYFFNESITSAQTTTRESLY